MRITVFGGSQILPGAPDYETALHLGHLLGSAGHTVLTGGYAGMMEAVSRGANEAGGHVIGVTCEEIEHWRPVKANPWVQEEWCCTTLHARLIKLIDSCEAAIALPGGPGTLTEIALTWNLLLTDAIPAKPLILIGPGWQTVFDTFYTELGTFIPIKQRQWIHFADKPEEAMQQLSISINI